MDDASWINWFYHLSHHPSSMPDWDVRITPIKYGNYPSTYAKPNAMSNSHLAMVGIPAFYGQFL